MIAVYSLLHTDFNIFDCHFMWATTHAIINLSRLLLVAYHYLSAHVTEEEKVLLFKGGVFDIFRRAEFAVLKQGFEWKDLIVGDSLTSFGEPVEYLYLLIRGQVSIQNNKGIAFATVNVAETDTPQVRTLIFVTRNMK